MSALVSIASQSVSNTPINTTQKLYIPLQLYNVIDYTYTYSNTQLVTPVSETAANSINVSTLALSYNLPTSYYQMFLFVNDVMNNKLSAFISNNTINATCNGVALNVSNGYFTSVNCKTNLTIFNTISNSIIYNL
jgi:hypothetical protein